MSSFTRTRRNTRRRDTESGRRSAAKGLLTLAAVGAVLYVGLTSYSGVPGRSYMTLYADVPAVGNLIGHDPVRIAGVRVGQVQHLGIGPTGRARVQLQLDSGVDIPADTDIKIRANGLLGARYVQLIPGLSRTLLRSGASLPGAADALTYGVPDALDALDAPTRAGLGGTVDGLGAGVLGHGESLNGAIDHVGAAAPRFTALMRALVARPGATARLAPALDRLMGTLDANRDGLTALLGPADRALRPLVQERAALRAALGQAPPALASATYGLGHGRRLLGAVDALARSADETLPTLPRGLRRATRLLRSSPPSLARGDALLQAAGPAIPAALKVTAALRPTLAPLDHLFADLEPVVKYVGPRACDIENFGVVMRSMTGFGGVGTGPLGPSMEFRAQVVPAPEALGPLSGVAAATKDAYSAPCKYLSKPYPFTTTQGPGR